MKHFFLTLLLFASLPFLHAQKAEDCRKIIDETMEAVENQSADAIMGHLAEDFSFGGQEGEIAKMVLQQFMMQFGAEVKSYKESAVDESAEGLSFDYVIDYKDLGEKEGLFVFNKEGKLQELSLIKIEVRTMGAESEKSTSGEKVIAVPFVMARHLIAVKVQLEGEERTFLLDSGAPVVVLNSKYTKADPSIERTLSASKGVNGEIKGMGVHQVGELEFAGIKMEDEEVITMDLAHLEEELESEVYGLIGYDMVKDYDLLLDYDKQEMKLIAPDFFTEYAHEHFSSKRMQKVDLKMEGHIPVMKGKIGGESYSLGLDTGAESNLMEVDLYEGMKKNVKKKGKDELMGAGGGTQKVVEGQVRELEIGGKKFGKVSTFFSDISHLNQGYGLQLDGLVGYPVLSKQLTLLSFAREELIFID